jgi:hypothetical protein
MATKLKIIEDVADIVPAPSAAAGRSGESIGTALPETQGSDFTSRTNPRAHAPREASRT